MVARKINTRRQDIIQRDANVSTALCIRDARFWRVMPAKSTYTLPTTSPNHDVKTNGPCVARIFRSEFAPFIIRARYTRRRRTRSHPCHFTLPINCLLQQQKKLSTIKVAQIVLHQFTDWRMSPWSIVQSQVPCVPMGSGNCGVREGSQPVFGPFINILLVGMQIRQLGRILIDLFRRLITLRPRTMSKYFSIIPTKCKRSTSTAFTREPTELFIPQRRQNIAPW